jgi:transposase-like protein
MKHRSWTVEQKRAAVERMKSCGHDKLAAELKVQRRQLYAWRAQLRRLDAGGGAAAESKQEQQREQEKQRLQAALANKVLEVEFFKGALRRIEARRRSSSGCGETAFTNRCE